MTTILMITRKCRVRGGAGWGWAVGDEADHYDLQLYTCCRDKMRIVMIMLVFIV